MVTDLAMELAAARDGGRALLWPEPASAGVSPPERTSASLSEHQRASFRERWIVGVACVSLSCSDACELIRAVFSPSGTFYFFTSRLIRDEVCERQIPPETDLSIARPKIRQRICRLSRRPEMLVVVF